eukprot:GHVO01052243.1.p2 GENE.GHVO01052243.1~~GHVO01052243.1.p2  ORF type:complete len:110 (+),score=1.82 GHVO01052243.1:221-550(+)
MFRKSDTPEKLEDQLFKGKRCASVLETKNWLRQTVTRSLRVCARRGWETGIGESRLRLTVLKSVPAVVEDKFIRSCQRSAKSGKESQIWQCTWIVRLDWLAKTAIAKII